MKYITFGFATTSFVKLFRGLDKKLSQARQNFVKPVIIFYQRLQMVVCLYPNSSLDESKRKQTQRLRHSSILFGTTIYKAAASGCMGCLIKGLRNNNFV